jgi:predicted porin
MNLVKNNLIVLTLLTATMSHGQDASVSAPVESKAYVSLRAGFNYVDSNGSDDAMNGRDFLSRAGIKAKQILSPNLTALALVEYGERGDNKVDFKQNEGPGLRRLYLGLSHGHHKILAGSQTLIWHSFVRSAYFSDGNDSLRQGAIRDDDLLQYYFANGPLRLAAGLHLEGQEGNSLDQLQLAVEYQISNMKAQLAWSKDQRGDNTGNLFGGRLWWQSGSFTASAYYHLAESDFDLYTGSSTGNVRLTETPSEGSINGVTSCVDEQRSSAGLYMSYRINQHQWHARLAADQCEISDDVNSLKVEYVRHLSKQFRLWAAIEGLDSDSSRSPSSSDGSNMSELQLGVRMDF